MKKLTILIVALLWITAPIQAQTVPRVREIESTALEASHVLKAGPGKLYRVDVFNTKASAQYILIMNSATVPADGAVTLLYPPIYLPATSNLSLVFTIPRTASTGISISNSSTGSFTKTIGAADCIFYAQVQ